MKELRKPPYKMILNTVGHLILNILNMSQCDRISKIRKIDAVNSEQNDSFDGMKEENIYLYWMLFIAC